MSIEKIIDIMKNEAMKTKLLVNNIKNDKF